MQPLSPKRSSSKQAKQIKSGELPPSAFRLLGAVGWGARGSCGSDFPLYLRCAPVPLQSGSPWAMGFQWGWRLRAATHQSEAPNGRTTPAPTRALTGTWVAPKAKDERRMDAITASLPRSKQQHYGTAQTPSPGHPPDPKKTAQLC